MSADRKEASAASAEERLRIFGDLDRPLYEAMAWSLLLDKVVDELGSWPSMTKPQVHVVTEALNQVSDNLKAAIHQLDACYHQREGSSQEGPISEGADRVLASADDQDAVLSIVRQARRAWEALGDAVDTTETAEEAASVALDDVMDKLLETPPMTLAGAREAIVWFAEYDKDNVPERSGRYMRTLAQSPLFAA